MSKLEKFICVDCDRSYTRKENFLQHFEKEKVRVEGVLVKNKCFGSKIRKYATTEKEKNLFKKQKNIFSFCEQKDKEPSNTGEQSIDCLNAAPSPQISSESINEGTSQISSLPDLDENVSDIPVDKSDQLLKNQVFMIEMLKQISSQQIEKKPDVKRRKAETKETVCDYEALAFMNSINNANSMKNILTNT